MKSYLELYSDDAKNIKSHVSLSGRLQNQEEALRLIVPDVVKKLLLKPTDSLLDIGCNCGQLTIPMSFLCKKVVGVDGGVISRLRERITGIDNIFTIEGDFREVQIDEKFDCILIYSVLVYMDSYEDKLKFILKAADLLKPGGRLLVGDVINVSTKKRFENSEDFNIVGKEYKKYKNEMNEEDEKKSNAHGPLLENILDDEMLMRLLLDIRRAGYESFILPQDKDMPFGYTRQDILVKSWK